MNQNTPQIFEGNEVEVITVNDTILFNPKDVAACLGIEVDSIRKYMTTMNDKQVVKITNKSDMDLKSVRKLNNTGENFLTESGVYKLVFKSRKPAAEKFVDWITDEVLPSIRKTGGFQLPDFADPAEAAIAWGNECKAKQIALDARDEAIATKAHIGDKKTATAMATASVKSRENTRLKQDAITVAKGVELQRKIDLQHWSNSYIPKKSLLNSWFNNLFR